MPDVHAGAGCTIGTTMTITDKIVPNLVGVDIGCGMEVVKVKEKHLELQKLDKLIYEKIPSGFDVRKKVHKYAKHISLDDLCCYTKIDARKAEVSLGTLGGGNHFIEADKGEDDCVYVVVHSGSRHLGLEVAKYYQEEGYKALTHYSRSEIESVIQCLKEEGRQQEIQKILKEMQDSKKTSTPKSLAYVSGDLFDDYLHDMKIVQAYAEWNRKAMMDEIIRGMGLHVVEQFTTIHNYIDLETMVLRKGAVSAREGEKLLIPINMRDGSLICVGKGNNDWNQSAPHGAGRLMSRSKAKESFTVSEFKKQMKGIYTTSVNASTLDECPMAYKSMDSIIGCIEDTVSIQQVVKPIYNFKASEQ